MNFCTRIPLFGYLMKHYQTAFFSYEWGKLLIQGLPLQDIFFLMMEEGNTELMKEMGMSLKTSLHDGESLSKSFDQWLFILPGLKFIILEGEITGKLGKELLIYGDRVWKQLIRQIEKIIQWVQPIVFIIVALLIISIYAAILLPMYNAIGGLD